MRALSLAVAFGLELWALVAFGLWGVHTGTDFVTRTFLGCAAPLVMALVWGGFLSPKAPLPLSPMLKLWAKLAVFALAVAALWVTGHAAQSFIFAGLVALNLLSLHLLDPYEPAL